MIYLTTTQTALLEAIKASLFGTTPNYLADTNWAEVVKEAKAQTVMALISPVIPVKDESVEQCKATYMRILYEQDQLVKLLEANNIPCVILKGSAAAIYYPKPYLRMMGDVDFLVPRDKFTKAIEVLEADGYEYLTGKGENGLPKQGIRHMEYTKNGVEFELHHHFSSSGFDIDDILENAVSRREYRELSGYKFPVLPDAENGLVLLGHINQHLKNNALGLRQIIDWEMYFNFVMNKRVWKEQFAPLAKEGGLIRLAVYVTKMCNDHLGLSNKIKCKKELNNEISDGLINVLFTDGNFASKVTSTKNNGRFLRGIYSIKKQGLYNTFQIIGLATWKTCKNHPELERFAFIYGIYKCIIRSICIIIKNGFPRKEIIESNNRYILFKRIGVQDSRNNK